MRAWTKGHELISKNTENVIGMTGTLVMNNPNDLGGQATAIDAAAKFKDPSSWFTDKGKTCVNVATITEFNRLYIDRVTEDILDLPPLTNHVVNFDVMVSAADVCDYNEILCKARSLRFSIERAGRADLEQLRRLMSYLQHLQQFLVSPLLAKHGAQEMKTNRQLLEQAASENTGALVALRDALLEAESDGHKRMMVAACHTSLLHIAAVYLKRECPSLGDVLIYEGSLSQSKRTAVVYAFLNKPRTVLLMSIDAGGTGLHLVPGCNVMYFWGSCPYSPMQKIQTSKRIHRIGQEHPVKIVHLIANGSVDSAITEVHADKLTLAKAVIDQEMDELVNSGGRWRTAGRIVDKCAFLAEDGTFPEVPITEVEAIRAIEAHRGARPSEESDEEEYQPPPMQVNGLPVHVAHALIANAQNMSTEALRALGLQL